MAMTASSRTWQVLALMVLLWIHAGAARADTFVQLDGDPGDFISGGILRRLDTTNGVFSAQANFGGGVSISFNGSTFFTFDFAPSAGEMLTPRAYENAARFPFQSPTQPGLSISGDGRGCNTLTGRFVILEIAIASDGSLQRFAADAEQHCEGGSAALFANVRFNSDIPILDSDVDGLIDIRDNCPVNANPDQGDVDGDGIGNICDPIQGVTVVFLDSEPGDFIGGGQQITIGPDQDIRAFRTFGGGVEVSAGGFTFDFAPPQGRPFTVGVFEGATRFPFNAPNEPGLSVSGRGRGCNTVTGRFEVLEARFAADGSVLNLAVDFEQHCEGGPAALFGIVRVNSESAGAAQFDLDGDGVINIADNCPLDVNTNQMNGDGDAFGDVCDPFPAAPDNLGACLVSNASLRMLTSQQAMTIASLQTENGVLRTEIERLRAAVEDDDGDAVSNDRDRCPGTPSGALVDRDGCSRSQFCARNLTGSVSGSLQCLAAQFDGDRRLQSCRLSFEGTRNGARCVAR